ncbi:uncharacterized protein LOC123320195 [Coccinella septempunctata]|uniref:uncharacterized protein LOC123320195 n=1 Tax=Coccinella septempunctata TaxID=41139 RepID=UPI001D08F15C|nr:uncharacterized protein LOC123320195 [Coccinella septempunctata]
MMFLVKSVQTLLFLVLFVCTHHVNAGSSEEEMKIMNKCIEEADVKMEDVKTFRSDQITDNMLCFMKCRYESEGAFDENGVLVKEMMQESYDDFGWTDEQRSQSDGCLDKMKPVKECEDLKEFYKCIPVINFGELFE